MFIFFKKKVAGVIYYVAGQIVFSSWLNRKNDPVRYCEVYKKEGCSYVDGPLCDMRTCSLRECNKNAN